MTAPVRCVHCGEIRLVWDGDFHAHDFGYEQEGVVRAYRCMGCGARYEVFVPDGAVRPTRHELEWLMGKFVRFFDAQPTYNDVDRCIREFAPHFIRWSNGRDADIWAGALED